VTDKRHGYAGYMQAKRATATELLCEGIGSRYGDSIYVCGKVVPQTDSKSCWRTSRQKMEVR